MIFDFDKVVTEASKFGEQRDAVRLLGTFNVEIAYASGSTRKKDGSAKNPTLGLKWKVIDGPQVGDEAWYNLVLTEKSLAAFGAGVLALGVPADFLRSLGKANGEDAVRAALEQIAEGLVGARYNITVQPQTKNDKFDDTVINTVIEAPDFDTSTDAVPTSSPGTASAPLPQASQPLSPSPRPNGGPAGIPGGFVPQLTNNS